MVFPHLSLALFVTRVGADDQQLAVPSHQLTVFANPLDARSHFHDVTPAGKSALWEIVFITGAAPTGKGGIQRERRE
jgi:hypothetical protein